MQALLFLVPSVHHSAEMVLHFSKPRRKNNKTAVFCIVCALALTYAKWTHCMSTTCYSIFYCVCTSMNIYCMNTLYEHNKLHSACSSHGLPAWCRKNGMHESQEPYYISLVIGIFFYSVQMMFPSPWTTPFIISKIK